MQAKWLLVLGLCGCWGAGAQTITEDVIIDGSFPVGEPLEKVVDYFTSHSVPSVVIGNGRGGLYLYRSATGKLAGPWKRSTITTKGGAYERARAVRFPGDAYPGVVASIGNKVIWFENPKNRRKGGSVTRQWTRHVINPSHGCHDIRLEDLDGDGKLDVICSGSVSLRAPAFVAFQDDREHWQLVYGVADVGDAIAVIRIGSDTTPHLVGAEHDGNVYWYENPRLTGGNVRMPGWVKHFIGPGNVGNSFAAGRVASTKEDVITVANENEGPGGTVDDRGITWYEQPQDPNTPWIAHAVGPDYRDMHEVNLGQWHGGVPYFLVAEQEQACEPARPEGRPPSHSGTPCRIAMFQWQDGQLRETVLANTSTQNQDILPWHGGLLMADANHGVYGASRAIHLRVIMP